MTARLVVLLAIALQLAGCAHSVRLTRPERVGDRVGFSAQGSRLRSSVVLVDDAVVEKKDDRLEVSLEGTVTVLAVDGREQATRTAIRVSSSSAVRGDERHEILPAGTTVVAESVAGKPSFTVDGAPVSAEAHEELDSVLTTHAPDRATDDEIFGTAKPRRVGESWPVNERAAAADLAKVLGGAAGDLHVSGSTTLLDARSDGGVPCLELEGKLSITGLRIPMPSGLAVDQADTQVSFRGLVPRDVNATHRRGGRFGMTMTVRASGQTREGRPLRMELRQEQSSSTRMVPAD